MEIARGTRRFTGLALRRRGGPLLIPRCRSVHTFGMRFELDLMWLDAEDRVIRVDLKVPPWRMRSCRAASSVLEVPSDRFRGSSAG